MTKAKHNKKTSPSLLVAARMITCWRFSRPSISVSSWFTTRTLAPDWQKDVRTQNLSRRYCIRYLNIFLTSCCERRGQSASISSKKMTHGAELRARWKTWRTARSLSPTYYNTNIIINLRHHGLHTHRQTHIQIIRLNPDRLFKLSKVHRNEDVDAVYKLC